MKIEKCLDELRSAVDALEAAAGEDGWIPCKWVEPTETARSWQLKEYGKTFPIPLFSFPDNGQEVLVTLQCTEGRFVTMSKAHVFSGGMEFASVYDCRDVVAWMPKPKPYLENQEDGAENEEGEASSCR